MKVLAIGSDRNLFSESAVWERVRQYATKVSEYNVLIYSRKSHKLQKRSEGNINIYPTNSFTNFTYVFTGYKLAKRIVKDDSEDWVITSQDPFEAGLVGAALKYNRKVKLLVQVHTDFLNLHFAKSPLNILRIIIAHFVLKRADGIRVVSSVIKDSIVKRYPSLESKISILPIFVDVQKIQDKIPDRDIKKDFQQFSFIIMMASRLTKEKRIDLAIGAMRDVIKDFPTAGLVICGSGSEKKNLQKHANSLGVAKNVVFAGWQNDLISYFKTSELYLLTSEYEGYGMTLIEAGASGCPIVTTSVGVAKTDLFRNGFNASVCFKMNSRCIAEELLSIMHDSQRRELYRRNMKDSLSTLISTFEEYSDRYIGLLEKLIK